MSLLEILGNYYDSETDAILSAKDTMELEIHFKDLYVGNQGLTWDRYVTFGQGDVDSFQPDPNFESVKLTTMPTNLNICNSFIPQFYINEGIYRSDKQEIFNVLFTTVINGERYSEVQEVAKADLYIYSVVEKLVRAGTYDNFKIHVKIKRHTKEDLRQEYANKALYYRSPKECFALWLKTEYHTNSRGMPIFAYDTVKRAIDETGNKERTVFLLEYLYGIKIPKSSSAKQTSLFLANAPTSDFGVKEVQKFKQVMRLLRSRRINGANLVTELRKLGIEPARDMKRWRKNNPDMETALKNDLTLA